MSSRQHPLFVVLLIAVICRLFFITAFSPVTPRIDMFTYFTHGAGLADGYGYAVYDLAEDGTVTYLPSQPTAYRPVGYPAFIAAIMAIFGQSVLPIQIAQALISGVNVLLIHTITLRLTRREGAALFAAALMAVHPNQIAYSGTILTETLSLFLLLLSVYVLMRPRGFGTWLLSGLLVGFAAYVKPQLILVPVVYFAVEMLNAWEARRNLAAAFAVVMSTAILVHVPWIIRNYQAFGELFWVSTNGGINLLIGNNPYATGEYYFEPEVQILIPRAGLNEAEIDKAAQQIAIQYMFEHPLDTLRLIPAKVYLTYRDGYDGMAWVSYGLDPNPQMASVIRAYTLVSQAYWRLLLIAFVVAVSLSLVQFVRHRITNMPLLPLAMIAYLTLLVVVYFGGERFRFTIDPWMIICVSIVWAPVIQFGLKWVGKKAAGGHLRARFQTSL